MQRGTEEKLGEGYTRKIPSPAIVLKRSGCRQSIEASKGSEKDSPPGLPKQTLTLIHEICIELLMTKWYWVKL